MFSTPPQALTDYRAQPGGGVGASMKFNNALSSEMLDNKMKQLQNQYYSPLAQADVVQKTIQAQYALPQMLANVMSQPTYWQTVAAHPEFGNYMSSQLSNAIANPPNINQMMQGIGNNQTNYQPNIFQRGISALLGGGQQQSQNQMLNQPQQQNMGNVNPIAGNIAPDQNNAAPAPNNIAPDQNNGSPAQNTTSSYVPATQGGAAGVVGRGTALYVETPFPHGQIIPDPQNPGKVLSTPDAYTIATSQKAILETENLRPIVKEIYDGADKWLAPGMEGKMQAALKANHIRQWTGDLGGILPAVAKEIGVSEKDMSDYANWKADQSKAVNMVMQARGWPENVVSQDQVGKIMTPITGEGRNYGDRVVHDLAQIDAQVQNYKNSVQNGFPVKPLTIQYPGTNVPVIAGTGAGAGLPEKIGANNATNDKNLITLEGGLRVPRSFYSKESFNKWFDAQPSQTKQAYKQYLSDKENG